MRAQFSEMSSIRQSTTKFAEEPAKSKSILFVDDSKNSNNVINRDFMLVQGKWGDDAPEPLHLKVTADKIIVKVATGEEIVFQYGDDTKVTTDKSKNTLLFEHVDDIISFIFPSADSLEQAIMKVPSSIVGNKASSKVNKSASISFKEPPKTAVDESDFYTNVPADLPPPEDDFDEVLRPPVPSNHIIKGYVRTELVDSHIKKPKCSIRRLKLLCQWVNSLNCWPNAIDIKSLHVQTCNGLFLAALMKCLCPSINFVQLNKKALTPKAAIENLEQALGCIWRLKSMNTSRIPNATEIYNGNSAKITILLQEIFEVYAIQPLYKGVIRVLRWYHAILSQYCMPLSEDIVEQGDLLNLWPHFQSGVAIFCLIYHLYGPVVIGEGQSSIRIDPMRIVSKPYSISEYRSNVSYVFNLMRVLNITVLWEIEDWITFPDTHFCVLQLSLVYDALNKRQCSLPPAQGNSAGVTSGPNGKPLVVGLLFSDSNLYDKLTGQKKVSRRNSVLLGSTQGSLPLLPIDNNGRESRFTTTICPLGLLSSNMRIVRAQLDVKFMRDTVQDRGEWNNSTISQSSKEYKDELVMKILKTQATTFNGNALSESQILSLNQSQAKSVVEKVVVDDAEELTHEQYALAIEKLCNRIEDERKDVDDAEDELAEKYIQLETHEKYIDIDEYYLKLDELDDEKRKLESERSRMEEHHQMQRTSLKLQYQESLLRHDASQNKSLDNKSTAEIKSSSNISFKKKEVDYRNAEEEKKRLIEREKGFITAHVSGKSSNYFLNKIVTEQKQALEASWSPRNFKASQKSSVANQSSPINNQSATSTELSELMRELNMNEQDRSPDNVFKMFKAKLHVATTKWLMHRHQVGREKMKDLKAVNAMHCSSSLISMPDRSTSEVQHMSSVIRDEELRFMQYEDERRRLVLEELSYLRVTTTHFQVSEREKEERGSASKSEAQLKASSNVDNNASQASQPKVVLAQKSPATPSGMTPTSLDVDTSYKWLSMVRPLKLVDRSRKDCLWHVSKDTTGGMTLYHFQWCDPVEQDVVQGYVTLNEVQGIEWNESRDNTLITILLGVSTKALKSSGGRTQVSFVCSNASEASKYFHALQVLRYSQNQLEDKL